MIIVLLRSDSEMEGAEMGFEDKTPGLLFIEEFQLTMLE